MWGLDFGQKLRNLLRNSRPQIVSRDTNRAILDTKMDNFPLRRTRFLTIPIILTTLTNKYIFLFDCQQISRLYYYLKCLIKLENDSDVFRKGRVENHLRNFLRNSRPEITNLLRNSRPDPQNGVSYKKKTCITLYRGILETYSCFR